MVCHHETTRLFQYFLLLILLSQKSIAEDGALLLYTDPSCHDSNTVLAKFTLPLSSCLVPLGIEGVVVDTYPSCPGGGNSNLIMYGDSVCGQKPAGRVTKDGCAWFFAGMQIPSLQFACEDAAQNPRPTSYTTLTATRPPPTSAASTSSPATISSQTFDQATTSQTSPASSQTTGFATSTSGKTGDTPSQISTTQGNGANGGNGGKESSGLTTESKISLGVGLGIGITTIILAILVWRYPQVPKSMWRELRR